MLRGPVSKPRVTPFRYGKLGFLQNSCYHDCLGMIHVIYSSGCFPKCVKCIIACIWRSFPFLGVWSMINWITV